MKRTHTSDVSSLSLSGLGILEAHRAGDVERLAAYRESFTQGYFERCLTILAASFLENGLIHEGIYVFHWPMTDEYKYHWYYLSCTSALRRNKPRSYRSKRGISDARLSALLALHDVILDFSEQVGSDEAFLAAVKSAVMTRLASR